MIFFQATKEDKVKFNTPNLSIWNLQTMDNKTKAPYLKHYTAYNLPPSEAEGRSSQIVFVGDF